MEGFRCRVHAQSSCAYRVACEDEDWGPGLWSLRCRVQDLGFEVSGSRLKGLRLRVKDLGFRVLG
jgi:hypothetical protein